MIGIIINRKDLDPAHWDALEDISSHVKTAILRCVKKQLSENVKLQKGISEKTYDNSLDEFINSKLTKSNNYTDSIGLRNLYEAYLLHTKKFKAVPLTKGGFRDELIRRGWVYAKAGGGKMVFRFMTLKAEETDEDWDL